MGLLRQLFFCLPSLPLLLLRSFVSFRPLLRSVLLAVLRVTVRSEETSGTGLRYSGKGETALIAPNQPEKMEKTRLARHSTRVQSSFSSPPFSFLFPHFLLPLQLFLPALPLSRQDQRVRLLKKKDTADMRTVSSSRQQVFDRLNRHPSWADIEKSDPICKPTDS